MSTGLPEANTATAQATGPDRVVVGAGSVGLHLAARLARAGEQVLLVTRGPEAAAAIEEAGIESSDPATGGRFTARVATAPGLEAASPDQLRRTVLLCTRSFDLDRVAEALARRQPDATAVCAQNGVGHEARLAPLFPRVLGLVVRQTSTRHRANAVRATGGGRCVVGVEPGSRDQEGAIAARDELVGALAAAGFDAGATDDLAADRWLKLCINLMSAPNALVRREDHPGRAFAELKARLLEEARAALGAEGIRAASGDGRDRSLDAEIEHLRNASQRGDGARPWPIYNSVWTALRGGGPFEVLEFHRRIVEMAGRHGLPAPTNRRVIEVLERSEREGLGPERWAAADLVDSRAP